MLIDKVRVNFAAGKGGDGAVSFEIKGKPNGGDGGDGGDLIIEGDNNIYDLKQFHTQKSLEAEDGEPGSVNKKTGADGADLVVKVPFITKIWNLDGELIAEITPEQPRAVLLRGGRGGLGNYYFRRGQLKTLNKKTPGKQGEKLKAFLELNLLTDVVFIGLPNAGKTSLLNAITNTKVKVADYPFTTLEPHLGINDGIVLMDFPGLIAGASSGKGLGSKYFRHTHYVKLLLHMLPCDADDPLQDYLSIKKELEMIDPVLADKPEVIVITKTDLCDENRIEELQRLFLKRSPHVVAISVYQRTGLKKLSDLIKLLCS